MGGNVMLHYTVRIQEVKNKAHCLRSRARRDILRSQSVQTSYEILYMLYVLPFKHKAQICGICLRLVGLYTFLSSNTKIKCFVKKCLLAILWLGIFDAWRLINLLECKLAYHELSKISVHFKQKWALRNNCRSISSHSNECKCLLHLVELLPLVAYIFCSEGF